MRLAVLAAATTGFVGVMVLASTGMAALVAGGLIGWALVQQGMNTMFPS